MIRQATDPHRLLLWMPVASASVGLLMLRDLGLTVYGGVLLLIVCFGICALFGPRRVRGLLLVAAPMLYGVLLLLAWGLALYRLPDHPASGLALLAATLHLPTLYVFLFLQWPAQLALKLSSLMLVLFIGIALPHTWATSLFSGPYNGVGLPLTVLFAHGTLLAVAAASMGLARRLGGEVPGGWLSRADQAMYARKRLVRA